MFCPRCGRQQAQDGVRFCNGCGFLLADVAEALRGGGLVDRDDAPSVREFRKRVTKALVVMTLSAAFFLASLILGTPEPSAFVQFNMLVGTLCYVFGLALITHAFLRKSKGSRSDADDDGRRAAHDDGPRSLEGLDPTSARRLNEPDLSEVVSADAFSGAQLKTNELVEPRPSVTEGTTRLLEKDL